MNTEKELLEKCVQILRKRGKYTYAVGLEMYIGGLTIKPELLLEIRKEIDGIMSDILV